jgi:hypothetical protein
MRYLIFALKLASPVFVGVGLLHLMLGAGAEVMLGADIPADVLADPVLDSQNRFYGVAFTVYGFLLWLCATDPGRYRSVLKILLWVFFAAGLARVVSIITHGVPTVPVLFLFASEILLPPLCLFWLRRLGDTDNAAAHR